LWLKPSESGFDFLCQLDGGHELWIGRCQPLPTRTAESCGPLKPMNAAARDETGALGDGAAEKSVARLVSQHPGRSRDSAGYGLHRQERRREPSPPRPWLAGWAKGGEAAAYRLTGRRASPRNAAIGMLAAQGTMGLRFARSDAHRPLSRGRCCWGPSLADVATCAAKAASS